MVVLAPAAPMPSAIEVSALPPTEPRYSRLRRPTRRRRKTSRSATRFTASDDGSPALTDTTAFTLTVVEVNEAPLFTATATDQTAAEDVAFSYTVPAARDPEGGPVAYTAALADGGALPGWLAFDAATRTFAGTPREDDAPASWRIRVTASDDGSPPLTDATAFTLTVVEVDEAPVFRSEPPTQWLAGWGRTVASQVLDGIRGRLPGSQRAGARATLAGQPLQSDDGIALAGWLRDHDERDGPHVAVKDPGLGEGIRSRMPTGRDILTGTAFSLTGWTGNGGRTGLWGRGAVGRFGGRGAGLELDGEVTMGLLGADHASGRWLGGLIVAHGVGEGSYRGASAGTVSSTSTGLYPWARYAVSEQFSIWSMAGYGAGTLTLTPMDLDGAATTAMKADTSLAMAATGVRGDLTAPGETAGPALTLESDAMFVRAASDATAELAASEAGVSRLRLSLNGSWRFALENGGALTPSLEVAVRHDGGDAETGFGVDLGGGIDWVDPHSGVQLELEMREIVAHEAQDFRDRSLSAALTWDPDPDSERGPSLSLTQSVGVVHPRGGADVFSGGGTLFELGGNRISDRSGRLGAEFGYGLGTYGGRFVGTPYAGLGYSGAERTWRLGWRIASPKGPGSFRLTVQADRRESTDGDAGVDVGIHAAARW